MSALIPLVGVLCFVCGTEDQLRVSNVRTTYGLLGPERTATDFLEGDEVVLCFSIEGTKTDSMGKVRYSIGMEVSDGNGKVLFRQAPKDNAVQPTADGKSLEAGARVQIGLDQPPGDYTLKLSIADKTTNATTELARTFSGAVDVRDRQGRAHARSGRKTGHADIAERQIYLGQFHTGRLRLGPDHGSTADVAMQVLDSQGREVFPNPSKGSIRQGAPAKARACQCSLNWFYIDLVISQSSYRPRMGSRASRPLYRFPRPLAPQNNGRSLRTIRCFANTLVTDCDHCWPLSRSAPY